MIDPDAVADRIRETAEAVILPRFGTLREADIRDKGRGDLVTVADTDSETMLTRLLSELAPEALVVGEEAVAADPGVLARLSGTTPLWIIDPIDGTLNFAAGREDFAVIVAYAAEGVIQAGWIHDPLRNITVTAERGAGAWSEGTRLRVAADLPLAAMRGTAYGVLPAGGRAAAIIADSRRSAGIDNTMCGGIDYIRMARGESHFALFTRSLPWDHAAGALIATETGGEARFLDGGGYDLAIHDGCLLVAPSMESWQALCDLVSGQSSSNASL